MNKDNLRNLESNFETYLVPFLDENDSEDLHLIWEFKKFLHSQRLRILTKEKEEMKKWKQLLMSK
jgi:hypothetical protein